MKKRANVCGKFIIYIPFKLSGILSCALFSYWHALYAYCYWKSVHFLFVWSIREKTHSIWPHLWKNKLDYVNPLFRPDHSQTQGVLHPNTTPYCFKYVIAHIVLISVIFSLLVTSRFRHLLKSIVIAIIRNWSLVINNKIIVKVLVHSSLHYL